MSYRDDRAALRERNEELRAELVRARAEVEQLRNRRREPKGVLLAVMVTLVVTTTVGLLLVRLGGPVGEAALFLGAAVVLMVAILGRQLTLVEPDEAVVLERRGRLRVVPSGRLFRLPGDRITRVSLGSVPIFVSLGDRELGAVVRVRNDEQGIECAALRCADRTAVRARATEILAASSTSERDPLSLELSAEGAFAEDGLELTDLAFVASEPPTQ